VYLVGQAEQGGRALAAFQVAGVIRVQSKEAVDPPEGLEIENGFWWPFSGHFEQKCEFEGTNRQFSART
jgi:hypothetical protein